MKARLIISAAAVALLAVPAADAQVIDRVARQQAATAQRTAAAANARSLRTAAQVADLQATVAQNLDITICLTALSNDVDREIIRLVFLVAGAGSPDLGPPLDDQGACARTGVTRTPRALQGVNPVFDSTVLLAAGATMNKVIGASR